LKSSRRAVEEEKTRRKRGRKGEDEWNRMGEEQRRRSKMEY
jgi:hypothetical protein